jgi:hypothetical protein
LVKRYLEEYGLERVDSLTNRDLFRVGHEQSLLRDAEAWLSYLKSRNLTRATTRDTYYPAVAETVYQSAKAFLGDARYLLGQLRARAQ